MEYLLSVLQFLLPWHSTDAGSVCEWTYPQWDTPSHNPNNSSLDSHPGCLCPPVPGLLYFWSAETQQIMTIEYTYPNLCKNTDSSILWLRKIIQFYISSYYQSRVKGFNCAELFFFSAGAGREDFQVPKIFLGIWFNQCLCIFSTISSIFFLTAIFLLASTIP